MLFAYKLNHMAVYCCAIRILIESSNCSNKGCLSALLESDPATLFNIQT